MQCPKCDTEMAKVEFSSVEVDRCTGCGGLWFDLMEAEQLRSVPGSEAIDTGDAREGKFWDAERRISCPVCPNTPMIRMVDNRQPHLHYESCPDCFGIFFDAGEFRDYHKETLLESLTELVTGKRP